MMKTRNVRRQIVGRVLKGIPIRSHFAISLRNAKDSLEQICKPGTHTAEFKSGPDSTEVAHFEIDNELQEFERDLSFIEYVQSDDADNVEQFVDVSYSFFSNLTNFKVFFKFYSLFRFVTHSEKYPNSSATMSPRESRCRWSVRR